MKEILVGIVGVGIVGSLTYGGWLIERKVNYSMDYKDKVIQTIKEQDAPLVARIKTLEDEIKILKNKGN